MSKAESVALAGCGLSAAPAVAREELMPDALVYCDPCVAGPQALGRIDVGG